MCAEHDPLICHRFLLVSRCLVERGIGVAHILRDGQIESHDQTEERLLKLTRPTKPRLLVSRADQLAWAYQAQNQRLRKLK
jgi:uncharacterized protein (DUF488 family)